MNYATPSFMGLWLADLLAGVTEPDVIEAVVTTMYKLAEAKP